MNKSQDPGLGSKYSSSVTRMINEDGTYNITRKGGIHVFRDSYKALLDVSWISFFGISLAAYILINIGFAFIYYWVGLDQISGIDSTESPALNAFFVSVQTFTTVGYGVLTPTGAAAGIVSTIQAFVGLMFFALITGVLYGRFSKPSSKIRFAKNAIITDYNDGKAIMFKMVNERKNVLLKANVNCILAINSGESQHMFNKEYHTLKLELNKIDFFPLTWTVVHAINEDSPVYGLTLDQMKARNAELIVLVEAFDETFAQNIIEKHSFAEDQWKENVRFAKTFEPNSKGNIELYINKVDDLEPLS